MALEFNGRNEKDYGQKKQIKGFTSILLFFEADLTPMFYT